MKVHRVARLVASGQINVFAMEFMVEISCLRKSATSSFCKVLLHNTRWPWFRKSLDVGPVIVILMFSKMQKSVVFFWFSQLCSSDGIWRLRAHFVVCRFAGVQQLLPVFETTSFKSF